ncbi:hypothetical protein EW146_g8569 [Bondarzewia mesenterica]|uniref:glutathione peroxidase n=1 Tax=Bondarzewia mesenterica TaxID=1095465 RepID=A0A4S4LDC7_9AGAM|nr:hypothetical protein EW146_g8569 [Bondarzewia mesenterica]
MISRAISEKADDEICHHGIEIPSLRSSRSSRGSLRMFPHLYKAAARRFTAPLSFVLFSSSVPSSSRPSPRQLQLMASKDFVNDTIAKNVVTIFSKSYCPYCKRAKGLFASEYKDAQVKILELDEMEDGSAIQSALEELTGQRTVPNIFINEKHIGGCDAIVALHGKGGIAPLIQA